MDSAPQHSLLIIDDHPVYREALTDRLSREFNPLGIEVSSASCASDGLDLLEASDKQWVVLLDILMPGLSGLAGIKVFKKNSHVAHVVAISGLELQAWEPRAISAGASIFLSKNSTSDSIVRRLTPLLQSGHMDVLNPEAREPKEFRLTQRQLEVLHLISLGHPNKVIADYLEIKEQTVKIHINQIFKELRVFNRTQAVLRAQQHQLLSSS
jgi:DNA-binding NarL/FixJ family response regulator